MSRAKLGQSIRHELESPSNVSSEQESVWLTTLSDAERRELENGPSPSVLADADLLVLGGGLVGLAVAYFAAERGARVQVIAESRLARDAEASLGCVIPNACGWQFSSVTQPIAQASRDWWAKLAVRPEFQLDWRVCGALMVDAVRLAPDPHTHMLAALDAGYSVHDVDAEQIALLEPELAPCPLGGLHYPSEAVLHPLRAACGFIRGLRRRGGQIAVADISKVKLAGGRLTHVEMAVGITHPKSVFADDVALLQRLLGTASPAGPVMESTYRVFLASTPQPPLLKRPVLDASWMVQLKSGEIVVEVAVTGPEDSPEEILGHLRQRLPVLRDIEFPQTWRCTSQRVRDCRPVVDKVSAVENAWYCGGLDFGSVLFAPIVGKSVSDWMLQGQPAADLAAFSAGSRSR